MRSIVVQIPKPCPKRWDDMHPTEQGRFCASCQKTVVDYSLYSDQELISLLGKSSQITCGQFRDDQLNRPLVYTQQRSASVWRHWVGLLTLSLVSWQSAWAQLHSASQSAKPALTQQPKRSSYSVDPIVRQPISKPDADWVITGRIMAVDSSGTLSPVPGIDVYISGFVNFQFGEKRQAKTDSSGAFHIRVPMQEQITTLKLWPFANKYITKTIQFEASPSTSAISVDDVIIRRMSSDRTFTITGGGICLIQMPSRWQKIKRKLFR